MNKNEIGVNAGKVWQLLSNNEKWSYGLLKRKSGLKDKELGAALGWLSRESKIEFDQCDEELYVSSFQWISGNNSVTLHHELKCKKQ